MQADITLSIDGDSCRNIVTSASRHTNSFVNVTTDLPSRDPIDSEELIEFISSIEQESVPSTQHRTRRAARPPIPRTSEQTISTDSVETSNSSYYSPARRARRANRREREAPFHYRRRSDPVDFFDPSRVSSEFQNTLTSTTALSRIESSFTERRASDLTTFGVHTQLLSESEADSASSSTTDYFDSVDVHEQRTCESEVFREDSTSVPSSSNQEDSSNEANAESDESSNLTHLSTDISELCVVCMDRDRDIELEPCGHTACCAACFMRLKSGKCPVCRTQADAIHFLGNEDKILRHRFCQASYIDELAAAEVISSDVRSSMLYHLPPRSGTYHGGPSMLSIARQAAPSFGFRGESTVRAFRGIQSARDANVLQVSESASRRPSTPNLSTYVTARLSNDLDALPREEIVRSVNSPEESYFMNDFSLIGERRSTILSRVESFPNVTLSTTLQPRNVVLLGNSTSLMTALVRKLQSSFGPPAWENQRIYRRDKSLLYIANEPLRLVVLERRSDTIDVEQFVSEVRSYSPRLVLLCADLFAVTSFELLVRLDLEIIDYFDVPCIWVLIKHDRPRQSRTQNRVELSDVTAAQHYLPRPRQWFIATVDRLFARDVKKLGREVHSIAWMCDASGQSHRLVHRTSTVGAIGRRRANIRGFFRSTLRRNSRRPARSASFTSIT